MPRAAISWSGGKDSCAALHRAAPLFDVVAMITMFDEEGGAQPFARAAPGRPRGTGGAAGTAPGHQPLHLADLRRGVRGRARRSGGRRRHARGVRRHPVPRTSPVGREHLRAARPDRGGAAVWCIHARSFQEWVASGAEAVIVTARAERLDRCWLGRTLSIDMLGDFDRLGVDPCGENGEYHTVVTNSPLFREPLRLDVRRAGLAIRLLGARRRRGGVRRGV